MHSPFLHYVIKVTPLYLMLHRFEIHSALELLRTALLCCHLTNINHDPYYSGQNKNVIQ